MAPLLEVDGCSGTPCLVDRMRHPVEFARPSLAALHAFAADKDLIDAGVVVGVDRADQWFDREKKRRVSDPVAHLAQDIDPGGDGWIAILNRCPDPYISRHRSVAVSAFEVLAHERCSLGEHLENDGVGHFHLVVDLVPEAIWDLIMVQVAHRINEDQSGASGSVLGDWSPAPGGPKPIRMDLDGGKVGIAPEATSGEGLGVAVFAPWRDLGAACSRVPRGVSPRDMCVNDGHLSS